VNNELKGVKTMRITKVEFKKHTPHAHDILKITTDKNNVYLLMDWEIQNLIYNNGELAEADMDVH